ncbi:MAG: hypothetical protein V3U54_12905 [Thermodesulfobacteriota bacterium]
MGNTPEVQNIKINEEKTMLATFKNGTVKELKNYVERLLSFVGGTQPFAFSEQGCVCVTMESSGAMFFQFSFEADAFSDLKVDEDIVLWLDLKDLKDILAKAQTDDIVTIKASSGDSRATLSIQSINSSRSRTYRLRLHSETSDSIDYKHTQKLANVALTKEMNCELIFTRGGYKTILEDLHVGDESTRYIHIETLDDKKVNFSLLSGSESSVAADVKVRLKGNEVNEIESISLNGLEKTIASTYDLENLEHLTKLDLQNNVKLHYNHEGAVRVIFESEKSKFTFLMAPMENTAEQEEDEPEEPSNVE